MAMKRCGCCPAEHTTVGRQSGGRVLLQGGVLLTFPSVGSVWAVAADKGQQEVIITQGGGRSTNPNVHSRLKTAKPTYQDNLFYQAMRTQLRQEVERDSL